MKLAALLAFAAAMAVILASFGASLGWVTWDQLTRGICPLEQGC